MGRGKQRMTGMQEAMEAAKQIVGYDIFNTAANARQSGDANYQSCCCSCCCIGIRCRFGVNYASSCSIDLSGLLAQLDFSSNGPRFYDPYLLQVKLPALWHCMQQQPVHALLVVHSLPS